MSALPPGLAQAVARAFARRSRAHASSSDIYTDTLKLRVIRFVDPDRWVLRVEPLLEGHQIIIIEPPTVERVAELLHAIAEAITPERET